MVSGLTLGKFGEVRVDGIVSGALHGWAAGTDGNPPEIEVLCDDFILTRAIADQQRPGLPPGCFGFVVVLPKSIYDGGSHQLSARILGDELSLRSVTINPLCGAKGEISGVTKRWLLGSVCPHSMVDSAPILELWDGGQFVQHFEPSALVSDAEELRLELAFRLPDRFCDGEVHDVHVTDILGDDLIGSPFFYRALLSDCASNDPIKEWAGFNGTLDHIEGRRLTGWALSRFEPGRRVEVELCDGEMVVDRFCADLWREDLVSAGFNDGRHGFQRDVPSGWLDGRPRCVTLRIADANMPLRGTPTTLVFHPPTGGSARLSVDAAKAKASDFSAGAWVEALTLALTGRDRRVTELASDLAAALLGRSKQSLRWQHSPGRIRRVVWMAPANAVTDPTLPEAAAMLARIDRDIPLELCVIDHPTIEGLPKELKLVRVTGHEVAGAPPLSYDLVLVPLGQDDGTTRSEILSALALGVPVLAAAAPGLPNSLRDLVVRDWERMTRQYLRNDGRYLPSSTIATDRQGPTRLLILLDSAEEVDLFEPLVAAAVRRPRDVVITAVVTNQVVTHAPRAGIMLGRHGISWTPVERTALVNGTIPDLSAVDAVLVGAESNIPAHRVAHALVHYAQAQDLPCYALQHGLETVGLTYFDEVHGTEVRFDVNYMFTWFPAEATPSWLADDMRARLLPTGSLRQPVLSWPQLPIPKDGRPVVGVFENLHWHRYDEDMRTRFVADLIATAKAHPEVIFLLKPHHTARWLIQNLPATLPGNTVLADPRSPAWEPLTAPCLMPVLAAVITTPSTVAHDAARAARPVAVVGGNLELSGFAPLPILRESADWTAFLDSALSSDPEGKVLAPGEAFLDRHMVSGATADRIIDLISSATSGMS